MAPLPSCLLDGLLALRVKEVPVDQQVMQIFLIIGSDVLHLLW